MGKYDELIKRLRDSEHEIDCSICDRDCCYPDGKVHGKCIIIEAADAIEAQDRHILTLQHEMMAEAESHIAEVNRLNKQIDELANNSPKVGNGFGEWIPVTERLPEAPGEYMVAYHPCYWGKVDDEIKVGLDSFRGKTSCAKKKYKRVTHWMPLPKPPKEEQGDV